MVNGLEAGTVDYVITLVEPLVLDADPRRSPSSGSGDGNAETCAALVIDRFSTRGPLARG